MRKQAFTHFSLSELNNMSRVYSNVSVYLITLALDCPVIKLPPIDMMSLGTHISILIGKAAHVDGGATVEHPNCSLNLQNRNVRVATLCLHVMSVGQVLMWHHEMFLVQLFKVGKHSCLLALHLNYEVFLKNRGHSFYPRPPFNHLWWPSR